jgi:chromosome partitioning protein
MAVIGILNPKGGVGKSLTTSNFGVALHRMGEDVLLVDADPKQKTLRVWKDFSGDRDYPTVIVFDKPTLHADIPKLRSKFQHILIDGGAKNDTMMANILRCVDIVVIPLQPSLADILGCKPLIELIYERQELAEGRPYPVFLINREVKNSRLAKEVNTALAEFNIPILETTISQSLQYIEAQGEGCTVFDRNNIHAKKLAEEVVSATKNLLEFVNEKTDLTL